MSCTTRPDRGDLEIRLLGTVEVIRGGRRQLLPASRKTRGLLAYLALAERSVRREELCDLMWENVADPRAELRWSLVRLRHALGPWLLSSRDGVRIAPEGLVVDAAVFRHQASSTVSEHQAREVLALWRGQPLFDADVPGSLRFHVWWAAEQEALLEIHRTQLHNLVDRLWSSPGEALAAARQLVAHHPMDEWGHARVSQALERMGRGAEARTYFTTVRRALSLELGLPAVSLMVDPPRDPDTLAPDRGTLAQPTVPPIRTNGELPLLGIMSIQVVANDESLRSVAAHITSDLAHGLWRGGICDVVEVEDGASDRVRLADMTYVVRGKLDRMHDGLTLSLRCETTRPTAALWYARYGPERSITPPLANWIGRATGAIQSSVQIADMKRARQRNREEDQTILDVVLEAHSLAALLEPRANHQALTLLNGVLNQTPNDARALALAAWCHAQRRVYNWSTDAAGDRGHVDRLATSAAMPGAADPICLTMIGTARTLLGDHAAANTLLNRASKLNPASSWTQSRLGWLAVYLDEPEPAIRRFRAAMQLAPLDPAMFNSMVGLGVAHFIKGQIGPAIHWMERGLALNPRAVWTYRNLVPAYIAAGDRAGSERGVSCLLNEYPSLNIAEACSAMVFSRQTTARLADGLSRAGLSRV
jgi:DNA-binding SARP family transcriptional activator/tetratricopeptide (TPR) repeat protein